MRVFWPRECPGRGSLVVGWQNSPTDFVVVCIAERLVSKGTTDAEVIATVIDTSPARRSPRHGFQVILRPRNTPLIYPKAQIVIYDAPDAEWMHHLSLHPIRLGTDAIGKATRRSLSPPLGDNLARHSVAPPAHYQEYGRILDTTIAQINRARFVAAKWTCDPRARVKLPSQEYNPGYIVRATMWVALILRVTLEPTLSGLERARWASAQQLHLRIRRICHVPQQWVAAKRAGRSEEYIRLYNGLWLSANDIILGIYLGQLVRVYSCPIADMLADFLMSLGTTMNTLVVWLTMWPAGLKLNTGLATFFGEILAWVLNAWTRTVSRIVTENSHDLLQSILVVVSYVGVLGVTMLLAVASDALSLATLHLTCFYHASARIYRGQLLLLAALFRLFRGKKWNVLRNRVDTGDYDVAQLLLGTILFTITVFLLPTVLSFYVVFATTRLTAVAVLAVLELALALLNHFPLFPVLLRIKSPGRVPGGIRITRATDGTLDEDVLVLTSQPIAMSGIFSQYSLAARHLASHYMSWRGLLGLLTGKRLSGHRAELYRVLESMVEPELMPLVELRKAFLQPPSK